jgi:hypothetical protein
MPMITGSMLYALVACPHRVTMDLYADPAERDPISPFVKLLWKRGTVHEDETMHGRSGRQPMRWPVGSR